MLEVLAVIQGEGIVQALLTVANVILAIAAVVFIINLLLSLIGKPFIVW